MSERELNDAIDEKTKSNDEEPKSNLILDAVQLLQVAEALHERCERLERNRALILYISVVLIGLCVIIIAGLYTHPSFKDSELRPFSLFMGILYTTATIGFGVMYQQPIRRSLRTDRRALHAIVDMLRELESSIGRETGVSTLERANFRIRLARFDIGPGAD